MVGIPECVFSHRLFLLLILLLTGAPILAQEPSDVAKKRAYDGFRYCQLHPLACAIRATKVMYLFIFTF